MDRRTFNKIASLATAGMFANNSTSSSAQTIVPLTEEIGTKGEITLEDEVLLVAFDVASGAITKLLRKKTGWLIHRRPELGLSFRMYVPLANRRDNFILGQKQRAARIRKISNQKVSIEWQDLISEHGGNLSIDFRADVTLKQGCLQFDAEVLNNSGLTIEALDYPYIGDLSAPQIAERMNASYMWYDDLVSQEIHPHFTNEKGGGVDFPIKTMDSKKSLFCLIEAERQGIYVGVHDPSQRYLVQYTFVQHPGVLENATWSVPLDDEISGLKVFKEFHTCHFIFAKPQSETKLITIALQPYDDDWHTG